MLIFALPPMPTPNASQWNIGCVGSPMQNFHVGNVHFTFFVLISFAFGGQRKPSFQWNMGLRKVNVQQNKSFLLDLDPLLCVVQG